MTDLRKRMMEDMQLHGYAERTRKSYAGAVTGLAKHYRRSPDRLTEDEIRKFFLHLINERKSARSTLKLYLCGIKFFYEKTLGRQWQVFDLLLPAKSRKLPTVLSRQEVDVILGKVRNITHKMALTLIYVCGLRLHEAVSLTVDDIDSKRMQIRVRGKGNKDRHRSACAPAQLLASASSGALAFPLRAERQARKSFDGAEGIQGCPAGKRRP